VIFDQSDTTGNAMLDANEFANIFQNPELQEQLKECGLDVQSDEIPEVFAALDRAGHGQLPWPAFRDGLIQLCKEVSSRDIMWLEGSIIKLDRVLRSNGVVGAGQAWDQKLDRVYARASLVRERVVVLEKDLLEFFGHIGYGK
jgi:hypothetical protein